MDIEVLYLPSYALAIARMEAGENLVAESGAMVRMSNGITVETNVRGGLLSGLKRSVLWRRESLYEHLPRYCAW